MRSLRGALAACVLAAPLAACGFDGGGLAPSDDGGADDASIDVSVDGGRPGSDAGGDHTGTDAGDGAVDAPVDAGCDVKAPEICNNGVDDNCDGKIDCADPMCSAAGWTCVAAPPPAPWSYVGYLGAAGSCPPPFSMTVPLKTNPMSTGDQCSCSCNVGNQPTTCDKFGILDCMGLLYVSNGWVENGGSCTAHNIDIQGTSNIAVYGYADDGTCNAMPNGAYTYGATDVTVCSGAAVGGGCGASQACAPPLANGEACVWQSGGGMACPTGFTKQINVGATVFDNRFCVCTQCSSGAVEGCPNATLQLWRGNNCNGGPDWSGDQNSCNSYNGPFTYYEFDGGGAPSGGATCMYATSMGTTAGALSLDTPSTVCCAN